MAKKIGNGLLLAAGAAGVAYLIFHKKPPTPVSYSPVSQPAIPASSSLLADAGSFLKNLLQKPAPVSPDLNYSAPVGVDNPVPAVIDPALQYPTAPLTAPPVQMAGFEEIPGTALAVICGACACAAPLPMLGKIGAAKFDWTKLIVPGVVLAGGYLLLKNLGVLDGQSSVNNADISARTGAANKNSLADALNQGSQKTMTDAQYQSLANDIYGQGLSFLGPISTRAMDQIVLDYQQCQTLADVLSLKIAFGVKGLPTSFWSSCTWLNINCTAMDLDTFVKLNLDADHIQQINNYFAGRGVNYKL